MGGRSKRVQLIGGLLLLLALIGCGRNEPVEVVQATQDPDRRFNLLIIVSDALRQDALGCYGGPAKTPNLDALARNGVLFENAYSTSPWTTPSSVSMFTGNFATSYPFIPDAKVTETDPLTGATRETHRPLEVRVPESEPLLMEAMRGLGYDTWMAVENANAQIHNNLQGLAPIREEGSLREVLPLPLIEKLGRIVGGKLRSSRGYVNAFVVLKRLLAQPADENFAALHWILDPHHPYEPVEEFRARIEFDADALSRPPDYYEDGVIDPEWTTPADDEYLESLYLAEVESVDERVGFLIEMLRFRGFLENTVIVFTSDHGEEFGNHGLYGHGGFGRHLHFYEGLLRVPLIIVAPGLSAGSRVTEPVTLLDLMPTLEDLLGIRYEGEMGGVSRTPLLRGEPMASAPLYFDDVQEDDQTDALRDGRFKIICRRDGRHELYDLVADPGETEDLSSKRPEKLAEMFSLVERFRQENSRRGVRKAAEVDPSLQHLSEEERARAMEQLRSLGYIE